MKNLALIVSAPSLETVKYGVNVTGGNNCSLSTYTGGSAMGPGGMGGGPGMGW